MEGLKTALIGVVIGAGAAAPGVSGGSLAVATGVYEHFFAALGDIRRNFRSAIRFLLPLIAGGIVGAALFVFGIKYLFDRYETITKYAFFGLMVGTFPSVRRRSDKEGFSWYYILPFLAAAGITVAAFSVGGNSGDVTDISLPLSALCGVIYGLGTIIPGVSSSLIFMSMGVYRPLLNMITGGDIASLWPMAVSAVLTVVLFVGIINRLFEQFYGWASYTFFGFLVGSTAVILPPLPAQLPTAAICAVTAVIGAAASYGLSKRLESAP